MAVKTPKEDPSAKAEREAEASRARADRIDQLSQVLAQRTRSRRRRFGSANDGASAASTAARRAVGGFAVGNTTPSGFGLTRADLPNPFGG